MLIVTSQEYLLQGSVLDTAKDVLIHRLRGLADNVDEQVEAFHDRERVLTLGPGQFRAGSSVVRAREAACLALKSILYRSLYPTRTVWMCSDISAR